MYLDFELLERRDLILVLVRLERIVAFKPLVLHVVQHQPGRINLEWRGGMSALAHKHRSAKARLHASNSHGPSWQG